MTKIFMLPFLSLPVAAMRFPGALWPWAGTYHHIPALYAEPASLHQGLGHLAAALLVDARDRGAGNVHPCRALLLGKPPVVQQADGLQFIHLQHHAFPGFGDSAPGQELCHLGHGADAAAFAGPGQTAPSFPSVLGSIIPWF